MNRWLVRFGYDGTGFAGWARQPGLRTVESEIRAGLGRRERRAVLAGSLAVASRTDRGVSARANALAVRSNLGAESVLRLLNGISPAIYFTAITGIPDEFNVRHAVRRTYRYFDSQPGPDLEATQRVAHLFERSIDSRSFGRGIPSDTPQWRAVESVTVAAHPVGRMVEVTAPRFVWGMVRKIVAALREFDRGRLSVHRIRGAVEGRERLPLPMAEPEGLVLWEIEYPFGWEREWSGPNRRQQSYALEGLKGARVRAAVLGVLPGTLVPR